MFRIPWVVMVTHGTRPDDYPQVVGYWRGPGKPARPTAWGPDVARFTHQRTAAESAAATFARSAWGWSVIPEREAGEVTVQD